MPDNFLGTESSLSNWAGPYVTEMLGRGQALSETDYTPYTGPLTAGGSPLQQQAWQGIGSYTAPTGSGEGAASAGDIGDTASGMTYDPNTFSTGIFDSQAAQQYMNPFVMSSLMPQLQESARQAAINRMQQAGRMTKNNTFGGGRSAVMDSENMRNLDFLQDKQLREGFNTAYDKAQSAFTSDQDRLLKAQGMTEDSAQFGAGFGLDALKTGLEGYRTQGDLSMNQQQQDFDYFDQLNTMGGEQRDIMSEGVAAQRQQFEEERDHPYKQVQFMQSLLQGLPLGTQSYNYSGPSGFQQFSGGADGLMEFLNSMGFGSGEGGSGNPQTRSNLINTYLGDGKSQAEAEALADAWLAGQGGG